MKDHIENMGSVDEMFAALANSNENSKPDIHELKDQILISSIHTFLHILPKFLQIENKDDFMLAFTQYHVNENPLVRNTAFHALYEYLLESKTEDKKPEKQIIRCEDSNTPCGDCGSEPTHRIKFILNDRTEEHFLCDVCETSARKSKEDIL